jgi:ubiquinone/menaquinone biosynthesis C-methylase UbiE
MTSYWNRFFKIYTGVGDAGFWLKHRLRLLEHLSGHVLEVCCGGGRLVLEMLNTGIDAYGIDLSPKMVEAARLKLSLAGYAPERIHLADVTHLPYDDGEFDAVLSTGAMGLLEAAQQVQAIEEIVRVTHHEIRLLEPFEKKEGLYSGRILAFFFDGMRPIPESRFQALPLDLHIEWDIFGGAFSYIHGLKCQVNPVIEIAWRGMQ